MSVDTFYIAEVCSVEICYLCGWALSASNEKLYLHVFGHTHLHFMLHVHSNSILQLLTGTHMDSF